MADDRWARNANQDLDVAFLLLDSNDGKQIQDVLGGNTLGISQGFHNRVKVTGYPNNRDTPISCRNRTTRLSATQMRIHCTNFMRRYEWQPLGHRRHLEHAHAAR